MWHHVAPEKAHRLKRVRAQGRAEAQVPGPGRDQGLQPGDDLRRLAHDADAHHALVRLHQPAGLFRVALGHDRALDRVEIGRRQPQPAEDQRAEGAPVVGDLLGERAARGRPVVGERDPDAGGDVQGPQGGARFASPSAIRGRAAK